MLSESPPIYQRESVKTSQLNKSDNKLAQSGEALLDILKGCQNNIEHHKETLYKSFYGYVKGVVTRYVTDFHYAEEIVNDSRSEEHTSELQSRENLVCRLLL